MLTRLLSTLVLLSLTATLTAAQEGSAEAAPAAAATDGKRLQRQLEIDSSAEQTLNRLLNEAGEAAQALYERAQGYAVFTATKAGFVLTGGSGTGVTVDKTTGKRTYMRMGTGGLGFGLGAQRYDIVILFEDAAHINRFIEGGWDASASALAAAGTDGIAVNSSFIDGVAFYQLTNRGLMAQADVSGTRFWPISALN